MKRIEGGECSAVAIQEESRHSRRRAVHAKSGIDFQDEY
jgi:hypothetical protein